MKRITVGLSLALALVLAILTIVVERGVDPFSNVGSMLVRADHAVDPSRVTFSAPC